MARPKTKEELIELATKNHNELINYIEGIDINLQLKEFPKGTLNRNIADVLAHLHHWHLMMMEWHDVGMRGSKPDMPAKGYTWKTVPELNQLIWHKYKDVRLQNIRSEFESSFDKIMSVINGHSNNELFEKKRYKWTGTTSLGAYLISATSSHYDWALKLIKRSIK